MAVGTGDTFRVAVKYSLPEVVTAYNILALVCTAGSATDAELLTAIDSWLVTAYAYLQTTLRATLDIDEARVTKVVWDVSEWVTQQVLGTVYPTFTATNANHMLPHASAGVVTLPTIDPVRKGKIFVPGICEDQQEQSVIDSGAVTALGNFANAIRTVLLPGTATVWYCVLGDDGNYRLSQAALVGGYLGSQRRRKPGVGI